MKKNKLYTVTKYNRPAFMPYDEYSNYYDIGGAINGITGKLGGVFGGSKVAGSPIGGAIGALGTAVGGAAKKILSGGYNSGAGNAVANIGGTVGGVISNFNPVLGGIVSAGTGVIGGGINALFGSKVDEKKLGAIKEGIAYGRNFRSNAGTFEDIKGPESFMTDTNAYSSGILARGKARRQNAELANQLFAAKDFADRSVENNVYNIWDDMVNDAMFNYSAFGGPLNTYGGALGIMQNDKYIDAINNRSDAIMGKKNTQIDTQTYFADGGGIHISPSKKGTFTAAASKHGMGVQEFASKVLANKEDYSPAMVKKANFARNASKWHAFGGELGTNGTDWTNGLLYVDNGGTHQQNPLGGVPVGFDQNGTPNLVEEGETIWNDYVFSDRMRVPKSMFHTLGLGGAMKKGITFAKASKKLAKESEQRPNDPLSMAGLEASLSKLVAVQEAERMKKEMRRHVEIENNMAAYGGLVNRFAEGGPKNTNIPEKYQNSYQDIVNWLMENNLTTSVSDIQKYARDFYNNRTTNANRTAAYKWLTENTDYNKDAVTKLADMMAGRGTNMSGKFDPEDAFDSLIPTAVYSEGRIEKYLKGLIDNGVSFDDAWNIVNRNTPKDDSLQHRRYNAQLEARLRDKYGTTSPVTNNIPAEEVQETIANDPVLEWGRQAAEYEAARRAGAEPAAANQTPQWTPSGNTGINTNTPTGSTFVKTPSVGSYDSQTGIIPYGYYTNGSDGYSTPTGFKVGDNGRAYDYTPEYRDLVSKLTADDIRAWAKEHPDDVSLKSFLARGNNLDTLTDEQWRTGATDGKYGFMHHVANSIMNGDNTPSPQMGEAPAPLERNTGIGLSTEVEAPKTLEDVIGKAENAGTTQVNDAGNPAEYTPNLLPTWMRYAPAFGGAIGVFGDLLGLTNKPDYTYADKLEAAANAAGYAPQIGYKPIGDYMRYTPFDRLFYANQLQANARGTDRMLANTSSPSKAAGLLANAYNTNNALGNLYRQGDEYNLGQYQQVKNFNRGTNATNSQMSLEAEIANARYRQAAKQYQLSGLAQAAALRDSIDQRVGAARSANLTNLFNSLGNIGRENFTFNQINGDRSRNYYYDRPWLGSYGYKPIDIPEEEEEKNKNKKG